MSTLAPRRKPAAARKPRAPAARSTKRGDADELSKSAITRLARQAGIKSLSTLVFDEMRGVTTVFVERIVRDAVILSEHARRKTVMPEDVKNALDRNGYKMYGGGSAMKRCKPLEGGADKQIRGAQAQSDCVHFERAPFERFVRQKAGGALRFSAEAMGMLQVATEAYLVKTLAHANLAAIHAKRVMVMPKDIQLVRHVAGERT